ncbi:hypothetical protein [Anditalea andensis]|nr:hypothetical protein [Anditalea andensis]
MNISKQSSFLLMLIAYLNFSCSNFQNEKEFHASLRFEKVDSVRINYLGQLNLMDINPDHKRVLLFNQMEGTFVITDFEGQTLSSFTKIADAPDSYGSFPLAAAKFSEDGQKINLVSNTGLFEYDLEGNLSNSKKFAGEKSTSFSGRSTADSEFYDLGDKTLIKAVETWGEYKRNTPEFYDHFLLLAMIDNNTGEINRFMGLEDDSIYKNGKGHDIADMMPMVDVKEDKIYIVVGKDTYLNVYDLNPPYALLQRTHLPLTDFKQNQGEDFAKVDPNMIRPDMSAGRISNVKVLDDYVIISYFQGYNDQDKEEFDLISNSQEFTAFSLRMKDKYPKYLLLLDKEGNKIKETTVPDGFNPTQFMVRDDHLWFMSNLNEEIEEDFWTVYKVALKAGQ